MFSNYRLIISGLTVFAASTVLPSVAFCDPETTADQKEFLFQETANLQVQSEARRADPSARKAEGLAKARAKKEIVKELERAKRGSPNNDPGN